MNFWCMFSAPSLSLEDFRLLCPLPSGQHDSEASFVSHHPSRPTQFPAFHALNLLARSSFAHSKQWHPGEDCFYDNLVWGDPAGMIEIVSAMRSNSTTDSARILCMAWPRCILTVTSVVPNSLAICLFNIPAITNCITSRSRGVRESYRRRSSAALARCSHAAPSVLSA